MLADESGEGSASVDGLLQSGEKTGLESGAPVSTRSLRAYHVMFPAEFNRKCWLELKLGYLLADYLSGPYLVYRDCDLEYAMELEGAWPSVRHRVFSVRKAMGRATRESDRKECLELYRDAVTRVRRLHRECVLLAKGYSDVLLARARFGPRGIVFLFDLDYPYGPNYTMEPKKLRRIL